MSSQPAFAMWHLIVVLALVVSVDTQVVQTEASTKKEQTAQETKKTSLERDVTQGALRMVGEDGAIVECPLKHTQVKAEVSGFIARVNVTQTFHNPTADTIEAVYVFPLPHEAAVDEMTMVLGARKIVGVIKRREEARRIYQQALMQGQTAALLEQERPNIFTQSVGNIAAGQEVKIHISYVDVLKYDMGQYEFYFPMVVGPRFIPGAPISSPRPTPKDLQDKVSPPVPNTDRVPDAERISPPVLKPEFRNGHDISLTLSIDAGVPVQNLTVASHQAHIQRDGESSATVELSPADRIPNKDFVVRYHVVGRKPELAVLAHTGDYSGDARKLGSGYFMLMIQPQEDERLKKSPPREIIFLVDVSGSMRGAKTDKTRETMQHMLGLCRDKDTVQVITFASQAQKLFERPLPVGEASIKRALNFTSNLRGSGGTRMLQGVKLAIDEPIDSKRIRIIVMLTDGFIGNEAEIIQHVGKHCGDQIRFWAIGIGQSPNMFLVDGVARQGGGMGKRLGLNDEAESLSHEVMTRIQRAQLANVQIDWGDMKVVETYPARIPELWAGRPVILFGRYTSGGRHRIHVSGTVEGEPVDWPLTVELPDEHPQHDVLAKVWARRKIEDLMQQSYYFGSPAVQEEVTAIALDYRLMTQYTSFVAVDEKDVDKRQPSARPPRRVPVPVPLPEGAEWEGFFGERDVIAEQYSFSFDFYRGGAVTAGGVALDGLASRQRGQWGGYAGRAFRAKAEGRSAANRIVTPKNFQSLGTLPRQGGKSHESLFLGRPTLGKVVKLRAAAPAPLGEVAKSQVTLFRTFEQEAQGAPMGDWNYTVAALRPEAEQSHKTAQAAMKSANAQLEQGDDAAARVALTRVCFLDQAAANLRYSDGQLAEEALAALEQIHRRQVSAWTDQAPSLANRLDLVIRNQSIAQALQQVAKAANMQIKLLPGSVGDAAHLTADNGRVSYLDLRGATLAQALDWILQPARLSWRYGQGGLVAGSDRRLAGLSAWVYDVSQIALPSTEELSQLKDQKAALSAASTAASQFIRVIRSKLKTNDRSSVVWFAPGQLLVFANPQQHALVADLLVHLADPDRKVELKGEAGKLQLVTAKRAQQRVELATELSALRHRAHLGGSHASFGWQLLASAAQGQLDDEAFTHLQIAWKDPATQVLLRGKGRALAMRSLWMVNEASQALPDEPELARLAQMARAQSTPGVDAVLENAEKNIADAQAQAALVYAVLARRDDAELRAKALKLLRRTGTDQTPRSPVSLLGESLLAEPSDMDSAALEKLVRDGVSGEDMVALAALACRRAGGQAWQTFRAESQDLLGSQPLPGHVIVLIHRLAENRLPLTLGVR